MGFDFGRVNDDQKAAIEHMNGPCRVIAGAGSGKTTVLTKRIAHLLYTGVSPKNILAITFTKKAATEMQERLVDLVGKEQGEQVFLGTFHSFGYKMIRYKRYKEGRKPPKLIMNEEQKQFMEKVLSPTSNILGAGERINSDIDPDTALNFISWQKNFLNMPGDDLDYDCLEDVDSIDDEYKKDLRLIYKAYEARKKQEDTVDFDDMLVHSYLMMKRDKEIRSMYQNIYKYILVDEFQDTNVAQYALVKQLAGGYHKNVFIVGDARQAIYSWRASKVDFILNFEKDWKNARTIELNDNYRSTVEVVDMSTEVIAHSTIKYPGICRSGRGNHGSPIMSLVTENDDEEANTIAYLIKYMVEEEQSIQYSDVAILYRLNAQSRPFEDAFSRMDIPYYVAGSEGFYGRREIRELLAYLHLAQNSSDSEAFSLIMNVPDRGLTNDLVAGIKNIANQYELSYAEVLSQFATIVSDDQTRKLVADFGLTLEKLALMNESDEYTVMDMLREIVQSTGYYQFLKAREKGKAKKAADDGEKERMIESFIASCERFPNVAKLDAHIQKIKEQQADKNKAKVQMMSLHRSKGLEFNTVFVVGMIDGLLPHAKSIKLDTNGNIIMESIEEERRLCYVGVTRAKERLILSAYNSAGKAEAQPSIFFQEIQLKTKDISSITEVIRREQQG